MEGHIHHLHSPVQVGAQVLRFRRQTTDPTSPQGLSIFLDQRRRGSTLLDEMPKLSTVRISSSVAIVGGKDYHQGTRGGDWEMPCGACWGRRRNPRKQMPVPCFATSLPWNDLSTVSSQCPLPSDKHLQSHCLASARGDFSNETGKSDLTQLHHPETETGDRLSAGRFVTTLYVPFAQNSSTAGPASHHVYKWVHFTV